MNVNLNKSTPIQPCVITSSKTATAMTVKCINLNLFNNAVFSACLLDSTGGLIESKIISLTPAQYSQWNNDDEYIINLVAVNLGVSPLISLTH